MKNYFFLLLLSYIFKCSDNNPGNFIPEEFEYPDSKIGAGKTFVYRNNLTKQQAFEDRKIFNINGQHFLVLKRYNSISVSDSIKLLNGKAIEVYTFMNGNPIKEETLEDTVMNNGQRLGIHLEQSRYLADQLLYTITSKEQFLKDTTAVWANNQLPCIVIQTNTKVEIKVNLDTSLHHAIEVFSKLYYAKSIGLIKYSIQFTDHTGKDNYGLWELEDIKNIRD